MHLLGMRHSTHTLIPHRWRSVMRDLLRCRVSQTSHANGGGVFKGMNQTLLLAALLAIIGIQPAVAQSRSYQVRTFDRIDQNAVARDRAAMAAADNAKRVAWAEYQQRLAGQRQAPATWNAMAARQDAVSQVNMAQARNKVMMREQAERQAQQHQDAIETAAATKAVEDVLRTADTRQHLAALQQSSMKTERLTQMVGIAVVALIGVVMVAVLIICIRALF